MLTKIFAGLYTGIGVLMVTLFLVNEWRGVVYSSSGSKKPIPAGIKSGRGYKSPGFWYTGYMGGK
ncbi:MAG: hypothetical protein VYC39_17580 [Myxococcota bacterium]|nr:hypothetical protein [Myxococcota bacterium]